MHNLTTGTTRSLFNIPKTALPSQVGLGDFQYQTQTACQSAKSSGAAAESLASLDLPATETDMNKQTFHYPQISRTMASAQPTLTTSPNGVFDLLGLPRELRDHIYRYLFFGEEECDKSDDDRTIPLDICVSKYPSRYGFEWSKPDLIIRQACRVVREEFDQTISFHTMLRCWTDSTASSADSTLRPVPKLLKCHVKAMFLKIIVEDDKARNIIDFSWLSGFSSLVGLCVAVITPVPLGWSARTPELRVLVADLYSNLPTRVNVIWDDCGRSGCSATDALLLVSQEDLRAVAHQMRHLQGCLIDNASPG